MDRRKLILTAVAGHVSLTVIHALVHVAIPVIPNEHVAAFATVSLYLLPVVGAGFAVSGYGRVGSAALFISGVASFVFEGVFHFIFSNPDHVAHVADHHTLFSVTATLTTVGNLLLVVAAWMSVRIRR